MQARGDAIVRHSNAPYHNTYIVRFDVSNDRIVQITEYANPQTYVNQGIAPIEVELRAVEPAAAISAIP